MENRQEEIRRLERKMTELKHDDEAVGRTFTTLKRLSEKINKKRDKLQAKLKKLRELEASRSMLSANPDPSGVGE